MSHHYSFASNRLIINSLQESDAPILFQIYSDKEAMKFRGSKAIKSIDDAHKMIEERYSQQNFYTSVRLAIRTKKNDKLIGTLLLQFKIENNACEIGFSFGKQYWNQGFAQETLETVKKNLTQNSKLNSLYAWCIKENLASVKVFEKAAFETVEQNEYPNSILFHKSLTAAK